MKITLLLALSLFSAQDPAPERIEPDVKEEKYGPHERNVLDLWKAKADAPTPLVVFIHGGGFLVGHKEYVKAELIRRCRDNGISVAAINYRFSSQAPFPAPFHDAARAIQYLRSKAREWNLDPSRFGGTGGSAGGGLSLWLAFHDDLADPANADPVLRQSSRLQAVVAVAAQASYDPRWIREHIGARPARHDAITRLYGLPPEEAETEKAHRLYDEAAPIRHLTKDDPPVYLTYEGPDAGGIHSSKFGEILKGEMDKLGLSCELKVGPDTVASYVEYFVRQLKKK